MGASLDSEAADCAFRTRYFFAKYALYHPGAGRLYRQFLESQNLPPGELGRLNWHLSQDLLHHAYRHSPYYTRLFDSLGLHPNDIRRPEHFAQVPLLTRESLMENFEDIVSDDVSLRQLRLSTTGGTSGVPARVYHLKRGNQEALEWRMLSWWGLPPDCNRASVFRAHTKPHAIFGEDARLSFLVKLLWWPRKKFLLNACAYTEPDVRRFLRTFNKIRPPLLHGYTGALVDIASFVIANEIDVVPPRAIWSTSSPLTPAHEEVIKQAFRAEVYDQYGSCEIPHIAAECSAKQGLHVLSDTRTVEFLDDDNNPVAAGTLGNIVVTDLHNRAFPLIRYVNGDRGRWKPGGCPCGISLPLMDRVKGRTSDSFSLPSGIHVSGESLTTLFDEYPDAIRQFQVVQRKDRSIVVNYVERDSRKACTVIPMIAASLASLVADEVTVEFVAVDSIPLIKGKLKFIIQEGD